MFIYKHYKILRFRGNKSPRVSVCKDNYRYHFDASIPAFSLSGFLFLFFFIVLLLQCCTTAIILSIQLPSLLFLFNLSFFLDYYIVTENIIFKGMDIPKVLFIFSYE